MTWIEAGAAVLLVALAALAALPLRIPRDATREGQQAGDAIAAYDQTCRWPVFAFGRNLVLRPLTRIRPQGLLIDVGCGPGQLTVKIGRAFPGLEVIGVDMSPAMTAMARRNLAGMAGRRPDFITADGAAIPLASNSVDTIVSSLSMHHWHAPQAVLAEMHRVLKPGGRLLIFDLRRDSPRAFLWALAVGQSLVLPEPIRRTNGAVGSLWSSYTAGEVAAIFAGLPFAMTRIDGRPAWLLCQAVK